MVTMSRGRFRAVLATTAVAVATTAALPSAVAQDEKEQAAKLYKEGVEAYFGADYGRAIARFREGFELDPNAMFLYNLSLCFSKLGNFEEALDHAERAQEMGGMPDEATTKNKARLAAFEILVNTESSAETIVSVADQQASEGTCAVDDDCQTGEVCNVRRGICVESLEPTERDPLFSPVGWAGVGLSGVGLGLLGAATVTSIGLGPDIDRHDTLVNDGDPSNDAEAAELGKKLKSRQSRGKIFLFTGLAATAIGGGLIVVDLLVLKGDGAEAQPEAVLLPAFWPSGGGFTFTTRF